MPKLADDKSQQNKPITRSRVNPKTRSSVVYDTKSVKRKAPPRANLISKEVADKDYSRLKFLASLLTVAVLIGGTSYMIGNSDAGQINVSSTITDRVNKDIESGGSAETEALQALNQNQNRKPLPNGGLMGRGNRVTEQQKNKAAAVPVAETSTTTATNTDDSTASTSPSTTSDEDTSSENEAVADFTEENIGENVQ